MSNNTAQPTGKCSLSSTQKLSSNKVTAMSNVMNAPTIEEIELSISRTLKEFRRSKQRYVRNYSISTQLVELAIQSVRAHENVVSNAALLKERNQQSHSADFLAENYLKRLSLYEEHLLAVDEMEIQYLNEVESHKASIEQQAIRLRQLVNISADARDDQFLTRTFEEIDADYELPERDPEARATVATYLRMLDK